MSEEFSVEGGVPEEADLIGYLRKALVPGA
ncbi:hypothetical protein Pan241w_08440 [Gimesia alba]|uniref:Uncharacterized protein n=1 Tax=Gimesia alba TaxID=2527973 RepID=A0A517RA79_9PLAN|nr:hypothetical protein Pan241w_08440 [Gimesia alba]